MLQLLRVRASFIRKDVCLSESLKDERERQKKTQIFAYSKGQERHLSDTTH